MSDFVHELRVRYHETDAQHHVYNARYLEYLDMAMVEYMRDLGWGYEELVEAGFDPVLGRVEMDFHRPARFDEVLRIVVRTERIGGASFDIGFAVHGEDGEGIVSASIAYINYDAASRSSVAIPPEVREKMQGGQSGST